MEKKNCYKVFKKLKNSFLAGFALSLLIVLALMFVFVEFNNSQVIFSIIERQAVVEQCVETVN